MGARRFAGPAGREATWQRRVCIAGLSTRMLRRSRGGTRFLAKLLVLIVLELVSEGAAFNSLPLPAYADGGVSCKAPCTDGAPALSVASSRLQVQKLRACQAPRSGARVTMGVSAAASSQRAQALSDRKREAAYPQVPNGADAAAENAAKLFRKFDPAVDQGCVPVICCESWDYLPRSLTGLLESPDDHPHVLQDAGGEVVAIGNVQLMDSTSGWIQAIRVHPERKGRGHGTSMTERLAGLCVDLGARKALTSTTFDNHAMLRVFAKTGFTRRVRARSFPNGALLEAVEGTHTGGASFLTALSVAGGEAWDDARCSATARDLLVCSSEAEAAAALAEVVAEARGKGLDTLPMIMAEYRVFALRQPEVLAALAAGRVFVKRAGPDGRGAALLVIRRSPTMRGRWIAGLTAADPATVLPALARTALCTPGENFQMFFSDFSPSDERDGEGREGTEALFSDWRPEGAADGPSSGLKETSAEGKAQYLDGTVVDAETPYMQGVDARLRGGAGRGAIGRQDSFGGFMVLEKDLA